MARRASSSLSPIWLGLALLVLLGLSVGGYFAYSAVRDPFRTLTPLDVGSYLENSNSLRGNVYKVDGTIESALGWSPTVGRLFSVQLKSADGNDMIAVLVPTEFNHLNIQRGQQFSFRIEVSGNGVLLAQDLRKI